MNHTYPNHYWPHAAMCQWYAIMILNEFHFSLKASLDWKYINDRYHKGRTAVEALMKDKHAFMRASSLVLAHSTIVQKQGEMGKTGFLSWGYEPMFSLWVTVICYWCHIKATKAHNLGGWLHPLAIQRLGFVVSVYIFNNGQPQTQNNDQIYFRA